MRHPLRNGLRAAALIALALAAPPTARAQSVYVTGSGGEFGTLNLATAVYTGIGSTSALFYGLGFSGGSLYGLGQDNHLYRIDTATAALSDLRARALKVRRVTPAS